MAVSNVNYFFNYKFQSTSYALAQMQGHSLAQTEVSINMQVIRPRLNPGTLVEKHNTLGS